MYFRNLHNKVLLSYELITNRIKYTKIDNYDLCKND